MRDDNLTNELKQKVADDVVKHIRNRIYDCRYFMDKYNITFFELMSCLDLINWKDVSDIGKFKTFNTIPHNKCVVRCINDNKTFDKLKDCAEYYGVRYQVISDVCHGIREDFKGLKFEFLDGE